MQDNICAWMQCLRHPQVLDAAHYDLLACCAGAHNTIVTSRAGKDLVSCLVSGLLTIGPRFGGAIDDAARFFQVWPSQLVDSRPHFRCFSSDERLPFFFRTQARSRWKKGTGVPSPLVSATALCAGCL